MCTLIFYYIDGSRYSYFKIPVTNACFVVSSSLVIKIFCIVEYIFVFDKNNIFILLENKRGHIIISITEENKLM